MVASRAVGSSGGQDPIAARLADLQRQIDELGRRTLNNANIGSGGITLGGGKLEVDTPDGVAVFYVGTQTVNGVTYSGFTLRRPNGSRMFFTAPPQSDANQIYWAWLDENEKILVSNDSISGNGLARPFMASTPARGRYQSWEATTVAAPAWETLWNCWHDKQHPKIYGMLYHTTDVSDTTGNWQVVNVTTGAVLASGTVGYAQATAFIGPMTLPGQIGDLINVQVQAQRTAGTGNVRVEVGFMKGVSS